MRTHFCASLIGAMVLSLSAYADHSDAVRAAITATDRMSGDAAEDAWRKPEEVLNFLGVRPGMRVLDYFAASGYYSELLSRVVGPKGAVIVYNNPAYAEFAGERLVQRFAGGRLSNARVVTVPTEALRLSSSSVDAVLFVMSYHDLYWQPKGASAPLGDPTQVLQSLFKALRPGGVVVIVDHAARTGSDVRKTVDALHRIDPAVVHNDLTRAGFVFDGANQALAHPEDDRSKLVFDDTVRHKTDQFIYRFRKPARR